VGSAVQELVVGNLYQDDPSDLPRIFGTLMASSAIATCLVALLWLRARRGLANL
jgi:hypothetical protein